MNSDLDFIEIIASKQKTDLDDSLKTENIKFHSITAVFRSITRIFKGNILKYSLLLAVFSMKFT